MHSLIVKKAQSTGPLPAAGPKLIQAIDQALAHLNSLAARNYEREGWPDHAKLWRELLNQSKEGSKRGIAPNILKGDLAIPLGLKVDGRRWKLFEKWYERHIEPSLTQLAERSKIPALKANRNSGSSDFPMGNLNRIQIKSAAVEIDGDLEMVTVSESIGTFLYSCNL